MADELVSVPTDLTLLSDPEIEELETQAVAEFDRLQTDDNVSPEALEYQMRLTDDIDRIRAERAGRAARAEQAAAQEQARLLEQRESLQTRIHGRAPGAPGEPGDGGTGTVSGVDAAAIAKAAAEGATAALVAAIGQRRPGQPGLDVASMTQRATASLAEARRHAPEPQLSTRRLAVTAGIDIPGVARGAEMGNMEELVSAFNRAAKGMPVTRDGVGNERLVATIRNEYEHVIDDRTTPAQVEELFNHLRRPEKMQALVAGGGWCAPSEIRYDFFNVAGVDGLVDLPTVGISRGGIKFPVSPSIADAFGANGLAPFAVAFSETSVPWLWTETDDQASVTGSPTKPTLRVPCPSFNEVRLECYGITLTAGNLTDDAYPESTANTLRLLLTAWQHAQNGRIISQMVSLASAAVTGGGFNGAGSNLPVFNQVVSGLNLACVDYRAKYAIPDETILEVVAPFWVRDVVQADLAWRQSFGMDLLNVSDTDVDAFFASRGIRVQWVNDWQVRGSNQFGNATTAMTAWPTAATFMVYSAGTFVKGNGLTLDLGVIRDSVLNKTNDFTAAFTEECHLVAKVGHEARQYTITFNVDGAMPSPVALGAHL